MTYRLGGALILALLTPRLAPAQDSATAIKHARAVRVPNGLIVVDGRLGDLAWQDAPPITGLLQKQPNEGRAARLQRALPAN